MSLATGGRERLARRAFALKKAWLLVSCMAGRVQPLKPLTIPEYSQWNRKQLEAECDDLESNLQALFTGLVLSPRNALKPSPLNWLAEQFDRWRESGLGLYTIATVQQFEQRVGVLTAHKQLEVPPYAELLLQPGLVVALRHPEYMLVRDLGLLYDLYRDAESMCDRIDPLKPPPWAGTAGENTQALARSVIQACFNLLESYISGLARAHVMTHPVDRSVRDKLLDTREPLRKRIRHVPMLITKREYPVAPDDYPLGLLFNDIKRRRDAFVHCEPGPEESGRGYVKEAVFHDISPTVVASAVKATHELIRQTWKFVHEQDGPRWLPPFEPSGRFGKQNLELRPRPKQDSKSTR
jgi:hypothetical protein